MTGASIVRFNTIGDSHGGGSSGINYLNRGLRRLRRLHGFWHFGHPEPIAIQEKIKTNDIDKFTYQLYNSANLKT